MSETDLQLGGGYTYQWECAILLALNYFFEPVRYNPTLFDLVTQFLGQVGEIHLEEDREGGVDLEDINLVNTGRRILIQVKAKQAEGERWTLRDPSLLKALYRFYDSRFLAEHPDTTRFVFLSNRPFNRALVQVKSAVQDGILEQCKEADTLCGHLARYARQKKGKSVDTSRFRQMLARTAFVEYLAVDEVKANVQAKLQAYGRQDWEQAHARLFEHFARQSTRIGGGTVTRASVKDVLGPRAKDMPSIPGPEQVATHRAALRDQLEKDARARWGGMPVYIQEEGATLPIEASPYQTGRLGPRENLLGMLHAADRLLVLGEPGSGKTVALERLAWELCGGEGPVVPVLVRLFHYAGTPLQDWMWALFQETGHLRLDDERSLAAFLKAGTARCFFLFDGLNEISPPYRDRLIDELVRWMAAYPRHPVVLTSRSQDELWRRLREKVGRAAVVQPIGDEQAQDYLIAHLGEKGGDLYARLDERLRQMARTPLILWLIKEAGAVGEALPGNRGELYARFVSRMLRRDTDRRMDAEIPERVKRQALADLAYHLGAEQRLFCPRDEAVAVAARRLGEERAERVVGACARHGLLTGEERVWFAPHQTVQEHFAALALREVAKREQGMGRGERLWRGVRRLVRGREEGLAALAGDDWWMETFVQLAGVIEDAGWLVREVARANPWLAWWCVEEGQGVGEETEQAVADRSVGLLQSERVADRRRAVATLARVRSERAVQPLFEAAADPDEEVAGLAVQALLELGQAVRTKALTLAQQLEQPLHRSGLAYIEALLGQPMVWVPPSRFLMGSDRGKDAGAYDDELPQHQVTLSGYWIGRYPVTVAQFRAFVQDSGYQPQDRDSLHGPDDHPVVRVTWNDATAYCRWLSEKAGLAVTLPSEAAWEKAARGTDGRIYPWGDESPDESRCNFDGNVGGTTPVGQYSPRGDSPYGCADMAGNVWEWCHSLYKPYPYRSDDGREDPEAEGSRVLRGGAFYYIGRSLRCAFRDWYFPLDGDWIGGFRIVVAPNFTSGL